MSAEITYKTHILIGVRENGVMTVIADWPHLPRQSEVQDRMNDARNGYVSFALCARRFIRARSSCCAVFHAANACSDAMRFGVKPLKSAGAFFIDSS
jgi:hypothetical protein